MLNRLVITLFILWFFPACSSEKMTPGQDIVVLGKTGGLWELELKVNRKGQGWSIHNFNWSRYDVDESYWIYVDSIKGQIPGTRVATTIQRGYHPFGQYADGYVEFDSLRILIDLKEGSGNPCKLNGTYRLRFN